MGSQAGYYVKARGYKNNSFESVTPDDGNLKGKSGRQEKTLSLEEAMLAWAMRSIIYREIEVRGGIRR